MCTSCKVQINGKGGQFSVAEGGQFYIAANNDGQPLSVTWIIAGCDMDHCRPGRRWLVRRRRSVRRLTIR